MYTLEFYPYAKKETIGDLVALKDGVVIHKGSVNLGDQKGVDEFIASVKEAATPQVSDEAIAIEDKRNTLLENIANSLNE